jgi:hypothetical protein
VSFSLATAKTRNWPDLTKSDTSDRPAQEKSISPAINLIAASTARHRMNMLRFHTDAIEHQLPGHMIDASQTGLPHFNSPGLSFMDWIKSAYFCHFDFEETKKT